VGAGSEGGVLHRALGMIAGFLYRRSQHIVVVTPAFKEHLIRHWNVSANKISIVENGAEVDLFRPCPPLVVPGAEGRFVMCYIGTMGMAHGLETLIATAEDLRQVLPKALFLMIGEGAEKERIKERAAARGLTDIVFLDQQPREQIPAYIAGSDVCLVLLKKNDLFKTVIPTKLLEYMACEKPVIVAVDGQARRIVDEAKCGIFVEPDDSNALADAILRLEADPGERRRMGMSGREYILGRLSREQTAATYIHVLEDLRNDRAARRS
jgi:colanic acid biosynthesis glycosyl transferase WcaI